MDVIMILKRRGIRSTEADVRRPSGLWNCDKASTLDRGREMWTPAVAKTCRWRHDYTRS